MMMPNEKKNKTEGHTCLLISEYYCHTMDSGQIDQQLAQDLELERQKGKIQQEIFQKSEMCWDMCVGSMSAKFDGKTESCIVNCVERYVDTAVAIQKRFQEKLSMGRM
uniref:Mitochondrial import inner membrane translocase subunit n=1 Tax=Magallana gigas TaxID=29159 RepID=A0A8W8LEZ1_MAGGI